MAVCCLFLLAHRAVIFVTVQLSCFFVTGNLSRSLDSVKSRPISVQQRRDTVLKYTTHSRLLYVESASTGMGDCRCEAIGNYWGGVEPLSPLSPRATHGMCTKLLFLNRVGQGQRSEKIVGAKGVEGEICVNVQASPAGGGKSSQKL